MRSKYSENQNQTTLKEALHAMINYYKLKGGLNQTKVEGLWGKVMGPSIAKHTNHIKLVKGKLFIDLNSASLKQELSYGKDKIKKILNEELGSEVVEKIFIK